MNPPGGPVQIYKEGVTIIRFTTYLRCHAVKPHHAVLRDMVHETLGQARS